MLYFLIGVSVLVEACECFSELGKVQVGEPSEINNRVCVEERKVILPSGIYMMP